MDAATVRSRLQAEGIACRVGRDGVLVASLMRPSGEMKSLWLKDRISKFPGTKVLFSRDRAAGDPYFEHSEVFFRVGPAPETMTRDARERAVFGGTRYPIPSTATPAEIAGGGGERPLRPMEAPACREDVTAGRDRHFDSPLGTRPESRPRVTTQTATMEGYADEVARAEGAVIPARTCDSPGRRPGSFEGPGRVSPGAVVGREQGRVA